MILLKLLKPDSDIILPDGVKGPLPLYEVLRLSVTPRENGHERTVKVGDLVFVNPTVRGVGVDPSDDSIGIIDEDYILAVAVKK